MKILSWLQSLLSNKSWEVGDKTDILDSIFEILPKRYTQFAACLLQVCKGVTALAIRIAAGATTDLASFYILLNSVFSSIIVQRNIRAI